MCFLLEEEPPSGREQIEKFLNGSCLYCPEKNQCPHRVELENKAVLEAIKACSINTFLCLSCPYLATCVKNSLFALGVA